MIGERGGGLGPELHTRHPDVEGKGGGGQSPSLPVPTIYTLEVSHDGGGGCDEGCRDGGVALGAVRSSGGVTNIAGFSKSVISRVPPAQRCE